MKKNIVYIVVVLGLSFVTYWLVANYNNKNTIDDLEAEYAFGVEDTAAVTKIVITDKTPAEITLTRKENGWFVNDAYKARPDALRILLETLHDQAMRTFVPAATQPTVAKRIAVYGKEVKVFAGDELVKHFFVGTETPDQLGTYMLMAGAEQPFAVSIQGFNGYLNSRYFTEAYLWRDRTIFGISKTEIASVSLRYPQDENETFFVENQVDRVALRDAQGQEVVSALPINMNIFLGSFRTANYEAEVVPTDGIWSKRDSIAQAEPAFVLTLTTTKGTQQQLKAYKKRPDGDDEVDENGLPLEWDPDRLYAFLDDGRMVLIQHYGLRNIIVTKSFFSLPLDVEN